MSDALPASGPGSRKRRRWFLGISGALVALALFAFRGVLLPFLLATIVAYVVSPLVAMGQRIRVLGHHPPRWAVVLVLYMAFLAAMVGLVAISVPRLAAEFSRLTLEMPRAVATVREQWLPEIDRRLKEATAPYLQAPDERLSPPATPGEEPPHSEVPALEAPSEAPPDPGVTVPDVVSRAQPRRLQDSRGLVPEAMDTGDEEEIAQTPPVTADEERRSIQIQPRTGGGFDVLLPSGGIRVVPEGEGAYRIVHAKTPQQTRDTDLTSDITAAVSRAMENTEEMALTLLDAAQKLIGALSRGIFAFVMMLMVSAYLLITSDRIFAFIRSLYPPERRAEFDELVRRIDHGLAGVVRGQLIICAVNGLLSGIGFYALDLKYWTFLTLLATVMSIIPIFGSILSTIPAVLVALPEGIGLALLVLAWIVLIHQIEANVLNPKIMGDSARVHPVLVVFALLAGEHVAGILGALLAVPMLSVTQTLFLYLRERFLGVPRSASVPPAAPPTAPTATSASAESVATPDSARAE